MSIAQAVRPIRAACSMRGVEHAPQDQAGRTRCSAPWTVFISWPVVQPASTISDHVGWRLAADRSIRRVPVPAPPRAGRGTQTMFGGCEARRFGACSLSEPASADEDVLSTHTHERSTEQIGGVEVLPVRAEVGAGSNPARSVPSHQTPRTSTASTVKLLRRTSSDRAGHPASVEPAMPSPCR